MSDLHPGDTDPDLYTIAVTFTRRLSEDLPLAELRAPGQHPFAGLTRLLVDELQFACDVAGLAGMFEVGQITARVFVRYPQDTESDTEPPAVAAFNAATADPPPDGRDRRDEDPETQVPSEVMASPAEPDVDPEAPCEACQQSYHVYRDVDFRGRRLGRFCSPCAAAAHQLVDEARGKTVVDIATNQILLRRKANDANRQVKTPRGIPFYERSPRPALR